MSKVMLLAAVSALALSSVDSMAASTPVRSFSATYHPFRIPKGAGILYNQNGNANGQAINSQNFTSGSLSSSNDQAADDFVVPKKAEWTITEVDISGVYYNGSGPAHSENVIFYENANGEPGNPVKHGTFKNLRGTDQAGNFAIILPGHGLKLHPGTYWVSVMANCSYVGGCDWGWDENSVQHGNQAMWRTSQNPAWIDVGSDLMFDLQGTAKKE